MKPSANNPRRANVGHGENVEPRANVATRANVGPGRKLATVVSLVLFILLRPFLPPFPGVAFTPAAEWLLVAGAGLVSVVIRLAPEAWLRGRAPPALLARALPWLPVSVAGALAGVLHFGASPEVRVEYLLAAVPAGLTLLWRRSFYFPLLTGAAALALLRRFGAF